ncbi:MAG: ribosome silencing factor, partial [Actinobacteria bacterium]|nr:ribosome silencing factor [Actinomycetota bacterium]
PRPELKDPIDVVKYIAGIADEKKADYIKILNVGPRLAITDYFIIISAKNTRLTRRIEEEIEVRLKKLGIFAINIDGVSEGSWILMDYDDFVVHLFTDEYRLYYDLERLWRDSKVIKVRAASKKSAAGTDVNKDTGEDFDINIEVEDKLN